MSGHSLTVRPATHSDADVIASVWLRSRMASIRSIPEHVHSDEEVRRWVADELLVGGGTWVAEGEVVGIIGMMSVLDGWIEQLYVDPGHFGLPTGQQTSRRCQAPLSQ